MKNRSNRIDFSVSDGFSIPALSCNFTCTGIPAQILNRLSVFTFSLFLGVSITRSGEGFVASH